MYGRTRRIHFIGIGGSGMSGLAEVLLNMGYQVSGSDLRSSEATDRIVQRGGRVFIGHAACNVEGAQVVVYSTAVGDDNPELAAARAAQLPALPRADMLAELMRMMMYGVAVGGAHGKTTTTSLIAEVLARGGLDPTIVVGGRLHAIGANARLGHGQFLVAEADESDGSFLRLSPALVVVTNIDREHLDHYKDLEDIRQAFIYFANRVPFYGVAVLCVDDEQVRAILPRVTKRTILYGTRAEAGVRAEQVELLPHGSRFRVTAMGQPLGQIEMGLPGRHNVLNALAAVAVGLEVEVGFAHIAEALATFRGVARRFETRGEAGGVRVVDDYGHHPTEIAATIAAARLFGRRLVVAFQPHRYSRTRDLLPDFAPSLSGADEVVLTDIYSAGEAPIAGVTPEALLATFAGAVTHASRKALCEALARRLRPGDLLLTLGAGDITQVSAEILVRLAAAA
jgi:UDP-N-acetylmuramate--alanine ligase